MTYVLRLFRIPSYLSISVPRQTKPKLLYALNLVNFSTRCSNSFFLAYPELTGNGYDRYYSNGQDCSHVTPFFHCPMKYDDHDRSAESVMTQRGYCRLVTTVGCLLRIVDRLLPSQTTELARWHTDARLCLLTQLTPFYLL